MYPDTPPFREIWERPGHPSPQGDTGPRRRLGNVESGGRRWELVRVTEIGEEKEEGSTLIWNSFDSLTRTSGWFTRSILCFVFGKSIPQSNIHSRPSCGPSPLSSVLNSKTSDSGHCKKRSRCQFLIATFSSLKSKGSLSFRFFHRSRTGERSRT